MQKESRFIPVDLDRIVEDLVGLAGDEAEVCRRVFDIHLAHYQLELSRLLKDLKADYHPFNPDAETIPSSAARPRSADSLARLRADLERVLVRANFHELAPDEVERALQKVSPRGLEVHVDLDAFDVLGLWARGVAERVDERRVLRAGLWRKERVTTPIHRRLCVFAKLREEEAAAGHVDYEAAKDDDAIRHDCVYVKLFRDIAHSDLEMLLPNTTVRMTLFDKVKLGVTGGGGTIGGLAATVTKIGAATSPLTWGFALAGFGGVLWRQVSKLFHQRVRYMAALARKLYCRNLDNNFGAITRLVELAEEEECKEVALAWFFLVRRGAKGASLVELDAEIEDHLRDTYGVEPDFEVHDAVRKLTNAGLLVDEREESLVARTAEETLEQLEQAWSARALRGARG